MKDNLLKQIDEVERGSGDAKAKTGELLQKLVSRGSDISKIPEIAKDNNIDMNNPYEFLALLEAIDRQL